MLRIATTAILMGTTAFSVASEKPMTKQEIASAERAEAVTIPTGGEFFAAMDKASSPPWGQFVKVVSAPPSDSRERITLILGTLVADGYVAVEAQDGQSVKNVGKEILAHAKKLNLSQSVMGRAGSINDFADANDWNALREELEATQNEVKLDMNDQSDDRLITLVSLGAWVRGADIASGVVAGAYTPEAAKVLRQPAIVEYLIERVDALPENTRSDKLVAAIRTGLQEALPLLSEKTLSAGQVTELHTRMAALYAIILGTAAGT